jgi:hypothetical protein
MRGHLLFAPLGEGGSVAPRAISFWERARLAVANFGWHDVPSSQTMRSSGAASQVVSFKEIWEFLTMHFFADYRPRSGRSTLTRWERVNQVRPGGLTSLNHR